MSQLSHPERQFVERGSCAPLPTPDVLALLDELLAAERAGVKVAAALREDHPPGRIRTLLDVVHIDEAESCRLLVDAGSLGAEPGSRVGDFVHKALAVADPRERLVLLRRGQRWVVRRLEDAIPRIGHPEVAAALRKVLEIHDADVAACEAVLAPADRAPASAEPRR
ncbi:MAG: DUF6306 domain-containing protein [Thermodesulfobacteriota bacterium]